MYFRITLSIRSQEYKVWFKEKKKENLSSFLEQSNEIEQNWESQSIGSHSCIFTPPGIFWINCVAPLIISYRNWNTVTWINISFFKPSYPLVNLFLFFSLLTFPVTNLTNNVANGISKCIYECFGLKDFCTDITFMKVENVERKIYSNLSKKPQTVWGYLRS